MKIKNRMEIARNILNNATLMNASKEILLKISQLLDSYILEYYMKNEDKRNNSYEEEQQ